VRAILQILSVTVGWLLVRSQVGYFAWRLGLGCAISDFFSAGLQKSFLLFFSWQYQVRVTHALVS
jgi:hypothetical protein